jgi:hypothetical protein
MSIINDKSASLASSISCAKQVLELIFPLYEILYTDDEILFFARDCLSVKSGSLNNNNFLAFKSILIDMFCLH